MYIYIYVYIYITGVSDRWLFITHLLANGAVTINSMNITWNHIILPLKSHWISLNQHWITKKKDNDPIKLCKNHHWMPWNHHGIRIQIIIKFVLKSRQFTIICHMKSSIPRISWTPGTSLSFRGSRADEIQGQPSRWLNRERRDQNCRFVDESLGVNNGVDQQTSVLALERETKIAIYVYICVDPPCTTTAKTFSDCLDSL